MARRIETREVVAVEWRDPNPPHEVVRGKIVTRTKSSAKVKWPGNERLELVHFADDALRFLTEGEA